MAVIEIDFVSREAAEANIFHPDTAVISITDPGMRPASLIARSSPVLRISFFDAIPGDDFIPMAFDGCFDHKHAKQIVDFVHELHMSPSSFKVIVHCEQGVSRSAAVALFIEAYTKTSLTNRWRAVQANVWVIEQLTQAVPGIDFGIPA
jgi:predicted protein tyrosine phosphatase